MVGPWLPDPRDASRGTSVSSVTGWGEELVHLSWRAGTASPSAPASIFLCDTVPWSLWGVERAHNRIVRGRLMKDWKSIKRGVGSGVTVWRIQFHVVSFCETVWWDVTEHIQSSTQVQFQLLKLAISQISHCIGCILIWCNNAYMYFPCSWADE